MVALRVTVSDTTGHSVVGLTADDFAVYEDGVQQAVSLFGNEQVPVDVALVLDTSSSMSLDLRLVKEASRGLVNRLRAGDRAAFVDVKQSIRLPQPFSEDRDQVFAAVDALRARGSTALYDGLYTSLREFERDRRRRSETRRQALVVLSDGLDNSSHVTYDDVAEVARRLDVTIYAIALRSAVVSSSIAQQDTFGGPNMPSGPCRAKRAGSRSSPRRGRSWRGSAVPSRASSSVNMPWRTSHPCRAAPRSGGVADVEDGAALKHAFSDTEGAYMLL